MSYGEYLINVEMIGEYIEYLINYKKHLEENLIEFETMIKSAKEFWQDQQYDDIVETKDKIAFAEGELLNSIDDSIRKLTEMNENYTMYLNM